MFMSELHNREKGRKQVFEHTKDNKSLYAAIAILAASLAIEVVKNEDYFEAAMELVLSFSLVASKWEDVFYSRPQPMAKKTLLQPQSPKYILQHENGIDIEEGFIEDLTDQEENIMSDDTGLSESEIEECRESLKEIVDTVQEYKTIKILRTETNELHKVARGSGENYYLLKVVTGYYYEDPSQNYSYTLPVMQSLQSKTNVWSASELKKHLVDAKNGFVGYIIIGQMKGLTGEEKNIVY
jgi:hypothetical protein